MRFSRGPVQADVSGGVQVKRESVHLLTEYVLNLSISARADNDITPLYETYLSDDRLGEFEREELLWVFMSLQLNPPATSEEV